ncbi:MAG: hypothetical protein NT129_01745 [Candidatus Aenigmarchaeota archaeon]|nr:hypothetical protein [Candidatus Aenigmarchaeota archaeon]
MPFHFEVDGQKKPIRYNSKLANLMSDHAWRSRLESGYETQLDIRSCLLDPEETTLAFLLPPAESQQDPELITDDGRVYKGKGLQEGSLYVQLVRQGATLHHNTNDGKRIEVKFIYEEATK